MFFRNPVALGKEDNLLGNVFSKFANLFCDNSTIVHLVYFRIKLFSVLLLKLQREVMLPIIIV